MTDEQININVAEACGWTDCKHIESLGLSKGKHVFVPGQYPTGHSQLPNYCNDLNAMHKAEKVLVYKPESIIGRSTRSEYEKHIAAICGDFRWGLSATARQRAEAFLRTIGKWEES